MIRIGTRGSLLATTQAGVLRDALVANGHGAELVIVSTAGDRSSAPIAEIGVGVFTAALREAIAEAHDLPALDGERHLVHRLQDAGPGEEVGLEVVHLQRRRRPVRRAHRASLGLRTSRMRSPTRLIDTMVMRSAIPGKTLIQ